MGVIRTSDTTRRAKTAWERCYGNSISRRDDWRLVVLELIGKEPTSRGSLQPGGLSHSVRNSLVSLFVDAAGADHWRSHLIGASATREHVRQRDGVIANSAISEFWEKEGSNGAALAAKCRLWRYLLPDRWLAKHTNHRWQIDQLRAEERKRSRQQRLAKPQSKS